MRHRPAGWRLVCDGEGIRTIAGVGDSMRVADGVAGPRAALVRGRDLHARREARNGAVPRRLRRIARAPRRGDDRRHVLLSGRVKRHSDGNPNRRRHPRLEVLNHGRCKDGGPIGHHGDVVGVAHLPGVGQRVPVHCLRARIDRAVIFRPQRELRHDLVLIRADIDPWPLQARVVGVVQGHQDQVGGRIARIADGGARIVWIECLAVQ